MTTATVTTSVPAATPILPRRGGFFGRLSDLFWRRPRLLLFLMLTPPLLWLGIIYIGSLIALLLLSVSIGPEIRLRHRCSS